MITSPVLLRYPCAEGAQAAERPEMGRKSLCNGHRPVSASRTAYPIEGGIPRTQVQRNDVFEKGNQSFPEFFRFTGIPDMILDFPVLPGEVLKLRDIVGVGEKTDIEEEVTVRWRPVLKPRK